MAMASRATVWERGGVRGTVDGGWVVGAARRQLRRSAVKMEEGGIRGVVSLVTGGEPNFSLWRSVTEPSLTGCAAGAAAPARSLPLVLQQF